MCQGQVTCNKTSKDVEEFIKSQTTKLQYSPPGCHCKPEEQAVQTYKSCIKSIIASLPPNFPISYWCRLIDQCNLVVNIVRPHQQNPKLSAWAACKGEFFFDTTPIALSGSMMHMQEKLHTWSSWGINSKKAWYVGPCFKHYISFWGVLSSTKGEKILDSVKFDHHVSNWGNKYISVFYIFDANFIKGIPTKSRHQTDLLTAYKEVYK